MTARGNDARRFAWLVAALSLALMAGVALLLGLSPSTPAARAQGGGSLGAHMGVASCAGSTCHGRNEAGGTVYRQTAECRRGNPNRPDCVVPRIVRHDEIMRWQEPSSPGGAHSRAYDVLATDRSAKIIERLGAGWRSAAAEPRCLGCHASLSSPVKSDGVNCETCHGPARPWLSAHYALGATHKNNVRLGLTDLNDPKARADVCLDCHFGIVGGGAGGAVGESQFVTHAIMAAGHPRIAFELDLFSTLQQHHDEDDDYIRPAGTRLSDGRVARGKGKTDNVRYWAVGQAMALNRALELFTSARGQAGIFPEFYFFDCHTCHRRIFDNAKADRKERNDSRGTIFAEGLPAFNDENMIMLAAAAKVAAPELAQRLESESRAFHSAIASDRASAAAAAGRLRATAQALATAFAKASFSQAQGFAIIDTIAGQAISARFTDYEGSVQSVMAIDTLLNAMVSGGAISNGAASGIRGDINTAYAAVKDPNDYRPGDFRRALGSAARAIRTLR